MLRFALRRLLATVPTLLVVVVISFALTRLLPGDPARAVVGDQAPPEAVERVRAEMGLDQPLPVQFVSYLGGLLRGDLGTAWHTGRPVLEDFADRLPATLELALVSLAIAVLVAVPLGIASAVRRDRPIDHFSRVLGLVGASMPLFWLGLLMINVFYGMLGWEPAPLGRIGQGLNPPTDITGLYLLDAVLSGDVIALGSAAAHVIWPALCLATGTLAVISRMTRSSMLEVVEQDYVRTARAKGMPETVVVGKHALKNAAPPVVTVLGLQLGALMGGAVITETIFSWPGIGSYVTQAILANDYAPVQAFTIISAVVFSLVNLAVDLVHGLLDPRVRHA
ncbi:ABC transporter permease [Marinitenerispora sediminis]|uniref:Peptide ABC transporter permease n=1 Tax=Marinitenerispora sediminis TaxID=1931232 RepID=A0A368T9U8_9ACTN|nr:ABC transporter permease [Marinitenerispora sediminis]RCV54594.1 peptide ABC transporter permease [Marinitenerispora sediminis]RCV59851.1 peptide ABC transporter permease [Marinitenerispora sediminis]RCV61178.1 peptide ABC transporter permease [Marinitenerispora sediminis]